MFVAAPFLLPVTWVIEEQPETLLRELLSFLP